MPSKISKASIIWDGGEISCSSEESRPQSFTALMVCRDCGCAFAMRHENAPPDFSKLTSKGFALEISEANYQNVIYFSFLTNKSKPRDCASDKVPAKICCPCPLCRPKDRPGYHFRDCSCKLCLSRRDGCLNRCRYELLAARKQARALKSKNEEEASEETTSPISRTSRYCDSDDDFVPRNRTDRCPCHVYIPENWYVKDPCPAKVACESKRRSKAKPGGKSSASVQMQHAIEIEPTVEYVTPSLSQQMWPIESNCSYQRGVDYFRDYQSPSEHCMLIAGEGTRLLKKLKPVLHCEAGFKVSRPNKKSKVPSPAAKNANATLKTAKSTRKGKDKE